MKNKIIKDKDLKTDIVKIYHLLNDLTYGSNYSNAFYFLYLNLFYYLYDLNLVFNKFKNKQTIK